ncbi:GumC family protein [Pelagibacterium montanilacus]|uniref:GumC family protein n=1 Tax=Pelagibacterium montanilacus TaxID=2185280 RepID=UPI000F8C4FFD|nr:GumC family protein [Pelagibacterium montanilacus]
MSASDFRQSPDASIDLGAVARAILRRLPGIILFTLVLCGLTYAGLNFLPRQYESSASLLVEPRLNSFTRATTDTTTSLLIDDALVASQVELIKARDTITDAIEIGGLANEPALAPSRGPFGLLGRGDNPSENALVGAISEDLRVVQERSSRLVTITFRSTDPEIAARVANAVAQAHIGRRAGQQISDTIDATAWLEREISDLRSRVAEAEGSVAEFRVANDLFLGSNSTSLVDQQLSELSTQITATAERRNAAQSRAELIRSLLDSGQSVSGVSDVQGNAIVQQLSQDKARLQGERAERSATLLSNHPSIRALDAQINEIDAQIAEEGRRVADALDVQARIEADLQGSLQADLEQLKLTAGTATRDGVSLAELEREATAQRELLNAYLIRFSEARARSENESVLPDVRLVSAAAISSSPVFPRTTLTLLAVLLGAVTLQVGAIIFAELLSGRALVENRGGPRGGGVGGPSGDRADAPEPELRTEPGPAADVVPSILPGKPAVAVATPARRAFDDIEEIAARLQADGERRIVIASMGNDKDGRAFAERLSARLVRDGLSVAEVDAASRVQGLELGLSDLCAEEADFGDVVYRDKDDRFAFVPWGQTAALPRHTRAPGTLVDALADIYEMVIVVTGKLGVSSTLPLFADEQSGCLVLVSGAEDGEDIRVEVEALGFGTVRTARWRERQSDVA